MALVVQNTLSSKKEEFKPLEPGKVKMYVCGITPYDECHVGHARCYVVFDVIRRYLEYRGYDVNYVQNYTDIDDKIINRANKLKISTEELVETNIKKYEDVMDRLNIKKANKYPRVTKHIKDIVKLVEKLIEKEYAYEVNGTVYFSVDKFQPYGKLSKRKKEDMVAGARIKVDQAKQNPLDFALWKKAKPEEPSWPSPWGKGRPGWHIECSVMSMKYLGGTLDIHGGGRDLIFPHHENEIAQSEAATGKQFSRFWFHNGFVTINEEKMSKSLGNAFTLSDLLGKYNSMVLRYFLLTKHYRTPIDFSDAGLEEAKRGIYKIKNEAKKIRDLSSRKPEIPDGKAIAGNKGASAEDRDRINDMISECRDGFEKAMDDDFNTAEAIGKIHKLVNQLSAEFGRQAPPLELLMKGASTVEGLLNVLGIDAGRLQESDILSEADDLRKQRDEARKNKDWQKSDEIRDRLKAMGYAVEDTPSGTFLKKK